MLVTLPDNVEEWVALSPEQLTLKRCVYWVSLARMPVADNLTSVTVSIPRQNQLTKDSLIQIMNNINDGLAL